jgi:hypothetical protein
MRRYEHCLRALSVVVGIVAVVGFVFFIPQGARPYLSGFVFSWAAIVVAVLLAWPADRVLRHVPLAVKIPVIAAGYFVLAAAFCFWGGVIERACPDFPLGDWLTQPGWRAWVMQRWDESLSVGLEFAIVMAVAMAADALVQYRQPERPMDYAYYPRIEGLVKSLSLVQGRMVLMIGFLVLLGGYADLALKEWPHGNLAGPEVAIATCLLGWNLLWIADCMSRPRHTTLWVAVAFFFIIWIALPPGILVCE